MQQLSYLAEIFVVGGIASAVIIAADLRSCKQPMRIMNSVWILTGLWASVIGLWAYFTFGRPRSCDLEEQAGGRKAGTGVTTEAVAGTATGTEAATGIMENTRDMASVGNTQNMGDMGHLENTQGAGSMGNMEGMGSMGNMGNMENMGNVENMSEMQMPARPKWESVVLSTLHCGAGCTLADLIGEWFMYFVPIAIGGSMLAGMWVVDYLLALVFGIGFQYAAIRGMERTLPRSTAIRRAAKADILSLTAWQAGMYGWMAIVIFVLNDGMSLPRTSFAFWFMMQIAMACGFLVSLPVNVLLIKAGIKKGM